jgi:LPS-assembly lipoprotein
MADHNLGNLRGRSWQTILALGLALVITGCGFQPLYSERGPGNAAALALIEVDPIKDRVGQKFRALLQEKLSPKGPPYRPGYVLVVTLAESRRGLAIRKDESATRANLVLSATFSLRPTGVGFYNVAALPFSGSVTSTNSYNVLQSEFATQSAETDARDRALRILAEEIRLRIAMALGSRSMRQGP